MARLERIDGAMLLYSVLEVKRPRLEAKVLRGLQFKKTILLAVKKTLFNAMFAHGFVLLRMDDLQKRFVICMTTYAKKVDRTSVPGYLVETLEAINKAAVLVVLLQYHIRNQSQRLVQRPPPRIYITPFKSFRWERMRCSIMLYLCAPKKYTFS